jgi:hypothetical protein
MAMGHVRRGLLEAPKFVRRSERRRKPALALTSLGGVREQLLQM